MPYSLRSSSLLPWILSTLCAGAAFAACGGGGANNTGSNATGHAGATGSGAGTNAGGGGGDLGIDGGNTQKLTVSPASAMLIITNKAVPEKQTFTALLDGSPVSAQIAWTLDTYAEGAISAAGDFTTTGIVGGTVKVTATLGKQTATADLTVKVDLTEDVIADPTDPGVSPTNKTALQGTPQADPGAGLNPPNATKILYPYDKTVMPRGLVAPLLQFSPGNLPPEDAKVTISSPFFSWNGFIHVKNGAVPQLYMPQDVWDGALLSTGGQTLKIDVTKAAAGQAYGPASTSIIVAPASLKGAVYYMSYDTPGNGLYSVRPGVKQPASLLIPGCVVCHSVSANGTRLATGADAASFVAQSGIYNVGSDGSAVQLTGSPPGLGGDSRGISFATFTPDGKYVMRSQNNFWGGPNQLAWKIDDVAKTLTPATVTGLGPQVSALVPAISPDTKHYAFTNGPGEATPFGTVSRSISLMDLAVDPATDTLAFGNRQLLLDNGPSGSVTKFVNFLPDPSYIVLQEGEGYQTSYDSMLPTWDPNSTYTGSTGRLYMVKVATKEHLELATLNAGNAAIDKQRNYEPFPLPVTAGGYFWIVFTSIREYGNVYSGPNVRKQLWVAAISTNPGPGEDPSHPPFYLPNQSNTRNERGAWALEPCKPDSQGCETGDECCNGFCRPGDPNDPTSAKVCQPPMAGTCSGVQEKCTTDADCCDAASGTRCIGGFCTPKSPT
jgi:hypothetical protein